MRSVGRIVKSLLAILLLCSWIPLAVAVSITVDPGVYKGGWYIGESDSYFGRATLDVPDGKQWVGLGDYVDTLFLIDVSSNGDVVVENGVSASGTRNMLTFRTAEIVIDPSGYDGIFFIEDIFTGAGKQPLQLVPGIKYQINIGEGGFRRRFEFSVTGAGKVTSDNTDSMAGAENVVRLLTTTINVDPSGYEGLYSVYPATKEKWSSGKASFVLPNGLSYRLQIGNEPIEFFVAEDGALSGRGESSIDFVGNTMQLKTVEVVVDPANYHGQWVVVRATRDWWMSGRQTLRLVAGVNYTFYVGTAENKIDVHVASDGGVTGASRDSLLFENNTITFRNTLVTIDPAGFSGNWRLGYAHPVDMAERIRGQETLALVPGNAYIVEPTANDSFGFVVDKGGEIRVTNQQNATALGSTLKFNTEFVEISPASPDLQWLVDIGPAETRRGIHRLNLVPGVNYQITANRAAAPFRLESPCKTQPEQLQIDGETVAVMCADARLDTDKDDIPDRGDNCPRDSNIDQADIDGDGTGDACDDDVDGDQVPHAIDNCREMFNPEQADADRDGIGDACDDDADNDNVPNEIDNCPLTANPDQRDRDGDGIGDACDDDLDKDGIPNESDNCPTVPNPDQRDTNKNEKGDACDSDADSDGIENARDNCPLIANPDQKDRDHDGRGDACDDDHDNDGVPDTVDNCPSVPDRDQIDTDKDGKGDACDDDIDNDGVANTVDNCPMVRNADQMDADNDGIGNACDTDDDNDGVLDTTDNCSLIVNSDQRNADGDKFGDACDDDIDGDKVTNANDACLDTALGRKVDNRGCSGEQLMAIACQQADYVEHGRYVSCVARAAGDALSKGLLTDNEKWRFISGAANR
ncbi:MAG: cartilage oligomeric matrix protein [Gammaproteobacteria bacterium]|nr:MAG: cartilage oligomeric matrix protein [Gammaproteobacteria bacterium]TND06762.1 MAG: cartilage oligomeric matrix protein [Gammaproteobacteria bacterium]